MRCLDTLVCTGHVLCRNGNNLRLKGPLVLIHPIVVNRFSYCILVVIKCKNDSQALETSRKKGRNALLRTPRESLQN